MEVKRNEVFEWNRFGRLVKMEMKSGLRKCRMAAAVFLAVYILIAVWYYITGSALSSPNRNAFILAFSMIFALYLPFGIYGTVNDAGQGIGRMLLPASFFEKYISMILVATISLPLLFNIVIYGLDNLLAMISDSGKGFEGLSVGAAAYSLGDIISDFQNIILLQSLFVCGNVVFRRKRTAKVLLIVIGFHIAVFALLRLSGTSVETLMASRKNIIAVIILVYKYGIPITLYVWGYYMYKKIELL